MQSLSEPEGDCSDCSSYEELSSVSDNEIEEDEELILSNPEGDENRRGSTASNYRSWYVNRRGSKIVSETVATESTSSKTSLTVINENQKTWWYWTKLAIFVASPFIARQLGIIVAKRILSRIFKSTATTTASSL